MRVADISVSRHHSSISCSEGEFYIEDNKSKFGTLVLAKGPVLIQRGSQVGLQIGRTALHLISKPEHFMCACCIPNL